MKNVYLDPIKNQKIERIKELLAVPCEERTEKMSLELMSFTKDFKLFEEISMSVEHQNLCSTMTLEHFKPNDIIVRQNDPGDSFFYILTGTVNIKINKQIKTGISGKNSNITVEQSIGLLKAGQTFGELALLYGTKRSATIVSVTNSALIKIDKSSFDKYVKNIFENQLQDQIEFLKICPVFHKIEKDQLITLAIRTESRKFATGDKLLLPGNKCEYLYIIRRGTIKVTKNISFLKNEQKIKKSVISDNKHHAFTSFNDIHARHELENEKVLDLLSLGPTDEEIRNNESINKEITLETLKIGDIFPTYFAVNSIYLDVTFEADNPCDLIQIKLSDIEELKETYNFLKQFSKPYPNDEFLRKFFYYNDAWMKYRNTLKYNILADSLNSDIIKKNKMRSRIFMRKDINKVKLPEIFANKRMQFG